MRQILRLLAVLIPMLTLGGMANDPAWAGSLGDDDIVYPPKVCKKPKPGQTAYLEFRGRTDDEFGHSYVILQISSASGTSVCRSVFGFEPATGQPSGVFTLLGVPGAVGYTTEDITDKPVERLRVRIGAQTVRKVLQAVKDMQQTWTIYQLLFVNCNAFASEIAEIAGLRVPSGVTILSVDFVRQLRELNQR